MELRVEAYAALLGFLATAAFLVDQNPYLMAFFAFFVQPLFALAAGLYLVRVVRDLRDRKVL